MREVPLSPPVRAMPAAPPLLEARSLRFEIGGKRLIDGIDLSLGPDGITMIMGANGAGKSLLLRLLHGLIRPTEGEITWQGRAVTGADRSRQAMVFQKAVLLRRSVAANVDFALAAKGRRDKARRNELLAHVALAEHARQPARMLSGGEQQRLALAMALAGDPELLFLDEPTASLDPTSAAKIEEIVRNACTNGTRIVFVTHDIGQARRLADEVVFLHQGRIVEHDTASEVLTRPETAPARAYMAGHLFT